MKSQYLELKSKYKYLEETVELLRQRLTKKEEQKCQLISLFKKIVSENQTKLESLQRENNNFQITIEEQSQTIKHYTKTIDELNRKCETLTKKFMNNGSIIHVPINIKNESNKHLKSQHESNHNFNHFTHPSFHTETKTTKKSQKKFRCTSQSRWSNLDITLQKVSKAEDSSINNANAAPEKEIGFCKYEKRRRLYCPDDAMVDLENEDD